MYKINKNDLTARHSSDLHYMKILRYLLRMICSWPQKELGEEVRAIPGRNTYFLFVEGLSVAGFGLVYVKTHHTTVTFLEMGQTYLTVFFGIVAAHRITVAWSKSYRETMKEFVLKLHLFHHRHKTEFHEHMYQYIHKICSIFVDFIHAQLFMGIILFTLTPIYNNWQKGMFNREVPVTPDKFFEHSINFSLPFLDQFTYDNLGSYIFIAILNVLFAYDAGICFGSLDLTLAVIVFHIWGHLKILDHNLRSIPAPADELHFTEEENRKVGAMLKNNVDHHRMIMSFMTNTSDAFGPMLCLYYIFHQVAGCIMLLEVAELDAASLTRYGALTITLFQLLIQISVIVELLGSQSETLKDAVYSVPWESMNTSNRKIMFFLLCNVQEPIRLKPMGIVSIGVQTMATILKTSFSYFMLLRTFD